MMGGRGRIGGSMVFYSVGSGLGVGQCWRVVFSVDVHVHGCGVARG
jgi:hypothetical protein